MLARPVVAIAVLFAIAGCGTSVTAGVGHGSGPASVVHSTPASRPTSNVRPGEQPPVLTSAGRTHTPLGALIFTDYWMQTLDWGYVSGDPTLAEGTYTRCHDCARFVGGEFVQARRRHEHYLGGRIKILRSRQVFDDDHYPADAVVDQWVSQTTLRLVSATGRVIATATATRSARFRTWLRWTKRGWQITVWATVVVTKHR